MGLKCSDWATVASFLLFLTFARIPDMQLIKANKTNLCQEIPQSMTVFEPWQHGRQSLHVVKWTLSELVLSLKISSVWQMSGLLLICPNTFCVHLFLRLTSTCTLCVSLTRRWRTSWTGSAGKWRTGSTVTPTPLPPWRCCPLSSGPFLMDQVERALRVSWKSQIII